MALVTIMGSPQEREAILWGKKSWSKMGQKVDKKGTKTGQIGVILGVFEVKDSCNRDWHINDLTFLPGGLFL